MYKVQVRNESGVEDVDIYIESAIEHNLEGYVSAKSLRVQLRDKPFNKIILHVNSEGGDLFEGIAIYNFLNELKSAGHEIEAVITGICASSASVVVMASDKISMYRNSYMMIHIAEMLMESGTSEDLQRMSEVLFSINKDMAYIYSQRSGLSELTVSDLMNKGSWLSAETCKALGLCDEVLDITPVKSEAEVQIENRIRDSASIRVENVYKRVDSVQEAVKNMAQVINKKRGYAV